MTRKHLSVNLNENNWFFLNKIRKEIMIENQLNIPINQMLELCLVELRKNNNNQKIKEKLVTYNRKSRNTMNEIINNL